jgi:hypothetical protein
MKTLWDFTTRALNLKEEVELVNWSQDNREAIHLFEEGPMEAMYCYYPDGIYRVILNNIEDAVWFRLKFC